MQGAEQILRGLMELQERRTPFQNYANQPNNVAGGIDLYHDYSDDYRTNDEVKRERFATEEAKEGYKSYRSREWTPQLQRVIDMSAAFDAQQANEAYLRRLIQELGGQ
jgi:hypothetical protein